MNWNRILTMTGTALLAAAGAHAATITDTTFTTTTTISGGDNFLERATATWTVNTGVVVNVSNGVFIESKDGVNSPAGVDAVFTIAGGGTVNVDRSDLWALRLGHLGGSGPGTLVISGGSSFNITNPNAGFGEEGSSAEQAASGVILDGVDSSFRGPGTFDILTQLFTPPRLSTGWVPLSFSLAGGATGYQVTTTGSVLGTDLFTTVTAVPEPTSLALVGIGGLLLARRRRNG